MTSADVQRHVNKASA